MGRGEIVAYVFVFIFLAIAWLQNILWTKTIRDWHRSSDAAFAGWQKAIDGWRESIEREKQMHVLWREGKDK